MSEQQTHSIHHDGWELRLRDEGDAAIAELWAFGANLSKTTLNTTGTGEVTVTSEFSPHVRGDQRTKCSANCQCSWELRSRDEDDTAIVEVWAFGAKLSETTLNTTGTGEVTVHKA
ncbi:hypothetical protein OH809_24855 [Streptomyces sp. NBC_00873]|uniref:hypothetical protein n=1 Tax=Streptomyces sp. NBC_00873 TaxID=2975852 RepID=UPI00386DCA7C|nr:hypothetical protein OH809_24855 [Streptomyces sp. NBC_00873]